MTTPVLSQSEIVARLQEIYAARRAFDAEEAELLTRLQNPKGETFKPVPLTFGKNIITWGEGKALYIKGKGYKFVKALYEADKMRLKEATLEKIIWNGRVTHDTFTGYITRLVEKLERAKFPYRLLPVKSKPKVELSGEKTRTGKLAKRFVSPEIIGTKLHPTVNCPNVGGK